MSTLPKETLPTQHEYHSAFQAILKIADDYEKKHNETNEHIRSTLLELYGFALKLCQTLPEKKHNEELIKSKIRNILQDFILKDLEKNSSVELNNILIYLQEFKDKLELIRTTAKESNSTATFEHETINHKIKELLAKLFDTIQTIIKPSIKFTIVGLGSLASKMTTLYSDIEYIILMDSSLHDFSSAQLQMRNLSNFFELLIISLGESPLYHAHGLIENSNEKAILNACLKICNPGLRLDKHKKPQNINPHIGLIDTPEGLLNSILTKSIHKEENHLTFALFFPVHIYGDFPLFKRYYQSLQNHLIAKKYLRYTIEVLKIDIPQCNSLASMLENGHLNFKTKSLQCQSESVEIKKIMSSAVNVLKGFHLVLLSHDKKINHNNCIFEILDALAENHYFTSTQVTHWKTILKILFNIRLNCQCQTPPNTRGEMTLLEFNKLLEEQNQHITNVYKMLNEIGDVTNSHLKTFESDNLTKLHLDYTPHSHPDILSVEFGLETFKQFHLTIGRIDELTELTKQLQIVGTKKGEVEKNTPTIVVCTGLGGVGKTNIVLEHLLHSEKYTNNHYSLKAFIRVMNFEVLTEDYFNLIHKLELPVEKQNFNNIKEELNNWLINHPGWIIVFDGVINLKLIEAYLPTCGGKVIITSRGFDPIWPISFKNVKIPVLSQTESVELLSKVLDEKHDIHHKEKNEVNTLLNSLGRLPLAIKNTRKFLGPKTSRTIADYNEQFKKFKKEMLSEKVDSSSSNLSVMDSLSINLILFEEDSYNSAQHDNKEVIQEIILCWEILKMFSSFSTHFIKKSVLKEQLLEIHRAFFSDFTFDNCIDRLLKYSLLDSGVPPGDDMIYMFVLSQAVLRNRYLEFSAKQDSWYHNPSKLAAKLASSTLHSTPCLTTQYLNSSPVMSNAEKERKLLEVASTAISELYQPLVQDKFKPLHNASLNKSSYKSGCTIQ